MERFLWAAKGKSGEEGQKEMLLFLPSFSENGLARMALLAFPHPLFNVFSAVYEAERRKHSLLFPYLKKTLSFFFAIKRQEKVAAAHFPP